MDNKYQSDPNFSNPASSDKSAAPVDPSNTSNVGQKVEQGVIGIKEGISDQSSEWEDKDERNIPGNTGISDKGEKYLKDPSPEEMKTEE